MIRMVYFQYLPIQSEPVSYTHLALLGGACLLAGCASGPQTQALAPAGFDRVTVGGELRQRIERNFDRLETDYYQPDQVYWTCLLYTSRCV